MITEEILNAIIAGRAVEFKDSDGQWRVRCLYQGSWCMPKDGVGWVQAISPDCLQIIFEFMAKYEWRLLKESRDWKGALEWLKEGKSVRRAKWAPQLSVRALATIVNFYWLEDESEIAFCTDDFEATDWEIVE